MNPPFVDQGYDISDYYAIAEEFGTMEEFDELLEEAKKRDMYIIMDLVINHCSDEHIWFQKALEDPEGESGIAKKTLRYGQLVAGKRTCRFSN